MSRKSLKLVGVDEAGRGPLAGPVVAAAVSLRYDEPGLRDSKKLSEKQRLMLFNQITQYHDWAFAVVSSAEIDSYNIHQASLLAFCRAVDALNADIDHVMVDGMHLPKWDYFGSAIIKGDEKVPVISAASIVAKVVRDRIMIDLDQLYPQYGFAKHKGYPTKMHLDALDQYGPALVHRVSYQPVKIRMKI